MSCIAQPASTYDGHIDISDFMQTVDPGRYYTYLGSNNGVNIFLNIVSQPLLQVPQVILKKTTDSRQNQIYYYLIFLELKVGS